MRISFLHILRNFLSHWLCSRQLSMLLPCVDVLSLSLSLSLLSSNILNVNFFRLQQRWVTNVPFKDSNDVKFTCWKLYIEYKPFYILFGVEYLDIIGYHRNRLIVFLVMIYIVYFIRNIPIVLNWFRLFYTSIKNSYFWIRGSFESKRINMSVMYIQNNKMNKPGKFP